MEGHEQPLRNKQHETKRGHAYESGSTNGRSQSSAQNRTTHTSLRHNGPAQEVPACPHVLVRFMGHFTPFLPTKSTCTFAHFPGASAFQLFFSLPLVISHFSKHAHWCSPSFHIPHFSSPSSLNPLYACLLHQLSRTSHFSLLMARDPTKKRNLN